MPETKKMNLEDILKPIERYLLEVEKKIPERLLHGFSLIDNSSLHLFKKSGKKIRASLVILSSGLKSDIPDDIIEIAAAVEIFHGASLVHDDIIDQTFFRRGDTTVSKEWGNKVAVLIGDAMYIKALQMIMSDGNSLLVPEVVSAALDMIKGEMYQMQFSRIDTINTEHYFNIIKLKTAEFMGICAKLGAMKSGMSQEESMLIYNYGFNLGKAYQIVDDTFDYFDKHDAIGKDAGNDFTNGKITLPLIHLLNVAEEDEKITIKNSVNNPTIASWHYVKELINKYNVFEFCLKTAEEYVARAIPCLNSFSSSVFKEKMIDLADFFVDRDY
jgi:octaprenyl-diphosphate synthase